MSKSLTTQRISVIKNGEVIFCGTRQQVADFLGVSYYKAYIAIVKGVYKDYTFKVIEPLYEVTNNEETLIVGTKEELIDFLCIDYNYFSDLVHGKHKYQHSYTVRRIK